MELSEIDKIELLYLQIQDYLRHATLPSLQTV